ncbi:ECF transporter S component [Sporohalobacter salinus]|uniref:ECF transporter S component n=1 Tax=Sporohalobacter salinus TaxID=1494606 RepID=UPI00195FC638|nr:ECF transporter S component [Sporohalobacter salinus]MBM7624481.1 riboflavin transporter FmnP [Sporohalobacter salinus]
MDIKKTTNIALLVALSLILMVTISVPLFQPFLIYEPGDVPILIITFLYGPISALGATFLLSVLMALFTGLGGPFGAIMHFLATGVLVSIAGYIYQRNHTLRGAVYGLICGSIAMTGVMAIANLILNPIFYGIPFQKVRDLLLPAIIPFNIVKSCANSGITVIIYKKLADFLRDEGLIYSANENTSYWK